MVARTALDAPTRGDTHTNTPADFFVSPGAVYERETAARIMSNGALGFLALSFRTILLNENSCYFSYLYYTDTHKFTLEKYIPSTTYHMNSPTFSASDSS